MAEVYDAHSMTDHVTTVRDGRPMVQMMLPRYFTDMILELLDEKLERPPTDIRTEHELRIMQQRFARVAALFEGART